MPASDEVVKLKNLQRSRESHELTRKALAVKAKTTMYTIDRAEAGSPINRDAAERLAVALGVKLASLAS